VGDFPLTPNMELVAEVTAQFNRASSYYPDLHARVICGVLNTAFWASMQAEEGHPVRASLALLEPELALADSFHFSDPIALSVHDIAKLSASFPFGQGAVAVKFSPKGHPLIWGIVFPKPEHAFLVEIVGSGYIVVRDGITIVAALLPDGSRIPFYGAHINDDWHEIFFYKTRHTLAGKAPFAVSAEFYEFLRILSRGMIDHRRGGSVLVVDPRDESWRSAVDFKYEFKEPTQYLFTLREWRKWQEKWSRSQDRKLKGQKRPANDLRFYPASKQQDNLDKAIKLVGGLTAVDGTMVMTSDLKILGYGAKLQPTFKKLKIREWIPWRESPEGATDLQRIGGTRHQSAARFVSEFPETLILVASQDGRFTIFCSGEFGEDVLALRTELLLL
jgi:hypothetical protein